jgi:Peroxidase, family 2
MEAALMAGYNMSHPLAVFLTSIILPNVGKPGAKTFDLVDLRKHNAIEHDVSLTRHDFSQGDNYTLQPDMLEALLNDTGDGPATATTLAKSRIRRTNESKLAGVPKLSLKLVFISVFNWGSALLVLGPSGIPKEDLNVFLTEERSPLQLPLERHLTLFNYFWQGFRVLWHNYIIPAK